MARRAGKVFMLKSVKKKHVVVLFLFLFPVVLLGISNYLFASSSFVFEFEFVGDNAVNVYPYNVKEVIDDSIYIAPPDQIVASVKVVLDKPAAESQFVALYFAQGGHHFNAARVVTGYLAKGSLEVIFRLPEAEYTDIRIDIHTFNETLGIEGIYMSESPLNVSRQWVGDYDGIIMASAICMSVILLWAAGIYTGYLDKCVKKIKNTFTLITGFIKGNPKKVILHIAIILAVIIIAFAADVFFSRGAAFSVFTLILRTSFYIAVILSIYCIAIFRKRPEILFLSLSMLIGVLYIAVQPPFWYGWDNGIHYSWALEESFVWNVSVSQSDLLLSRVPEFYPFFGFISDIGIDHDFSWWRSQSDAALFSFRKGADTLASVTLREQLLFVRLAHIPSGLFIFLGRSLALAPFVVVKLGAFANHIVYTLLVYFAIKRLGSGKHIMAVTAMFPTAFAMSTTFGYDYWLIGFLMLGFAYFFHEVQNPDTKISKKNLIIMLCAFFVSMGPKAVYVPLMLILYFMKKEKFKTKKGYMGYVITVSCLILFVVASFALPFISASGAVGEGDLRGGSGVSTSGQVMFILQNPLAYTGILLRFLRSHLNMFSQNYITYFAHFREASLVHLVWILLGFVVLTDRNKSDMLTSTAKYKIIMAFLVFATASLYSTAMYIGFTEVGASTILGIQGRYKIPFLFPLLYVLGSFKIRNNINEAAYTCSVYGIMSFVLLAGAWEKFL